MKKINWFKVLDTFTFAFCGATLFYMWVACCLFLANFMSDTPFASQWYKIASILFYLGLAYFVSYIIRGAYKKLKGVHQ